MGKKIMGVGEYGSSKDPTDTICTYALGSCVAVVMIDTKNRIAGLVHVALPDSNIDKTKAEKLPGFYADTGIPVLLESMRTLGANPLNQFISVKLFGGISTIMGKSRGDIGKRNILSIRKILWKLGMLVTVEDVGGDQIRSVFVDVKDCKTTIKVHGIEPKVY